MSRADRITIVIYMLPNFRRLGRQEDGLQPTQQSDKRELGPQAWEVF